MTAKQSKSLPAIGFMAVDETSEGDLLGGLLVVNPRLRPLEFHCTAPVRANRAQQILYGSTLRPYLYGEQIGPALTASAAARLSLILVDAAAMEPLAEHVDVPVGLVHGPGESAKDFRQSGCARWRVAGGVCRWFPIVATRRRWLRWSGNSTPPST